MELVSTIDVFTLLTDEVTVFGHPCVIDKNVHSSKVGTYPLECSYDILLLADVTF